MERLRDPRSYGIRGFAYLVADEVVGLQRESTRMGRLRDPRSEVTVGIARLVDEEVVDLDGEAA